MAKNDRGAKGGDSNVVGNDSNAIGGDAGESVVEPGGSGGNATVRGNNSIAAGGRGGRGGIAPGGNGGHAAVDGDNAAYIGGDGGEGGQADGRGGRGAKSTLHRAIELGMIRPENWGLRDVDTFTYGAGGDGACSPQYTARLMIVSAFVGKNLSIRASSAGITDAAAAEAFAAHVNGHLEAKNHDWCLRITDGCFEFVDL
jgi:hypothetical protein